MLKQEEGYGCGLCAVANAINITGFITKERLETSRAVGNTIGQLSKWMQDDGHPFYIDVLFYDHFGKKLPESAHDYRPVGDSVNFLPIMINCRFSEEGKNHLIGGKIDKDGKLYLYDSLKENVVETTLKEVNEMYHTVYGLYIFMGVDNGDYAFI